MSFMLDTNAPCAPYPDVSLTSAIVNENTFTSGYKIQSLLESRLPRTVFTVDSSARPVYTEGPVAVYTAGNIIGPIPGTKIDSYNPPKDHDIGQAEWDKYLHTIQTEPKYVPSPTTSAVMDIWNDQFQKRV